MSSKKTTLLYVTTRLACFFVPFFGLLWLNIHWFVAAVLASIVGVCLMYLCFRNLTTAFSTQLASLREHRKTKNRSNDAAYEDSIIENFET